MITLDEKSKEEKEAETINGSVKVNYFSLNMSFLAYLSDIKGMNKLFSCFVFSLACQILIERAVEVHQLFVFHIDDVCRK